MTALSPVLVGDKILKSGENMRVLITGAAGFLGSHLCDRLLLEGHQVIAMDNFVTGNVENITHLAGNTNFEFIKHDVSEFIFL